MNASSQIPLSNGEKTSTKKSVLSLGLALPFHPCMQDEKTIGHVLEDSEKRAHEMLERLPDPMYANDMFARLQKVIGKLNYNSHCKSITILLTPEEEKVTYLNFPVRPVSYLNKYVSPLELVANAERPPDFYNLVFDESNANLYEYYHNHLYQIYATKQQPGSNGKLNSGSLFKQVSQTIERLNGNNEKPVFVTGSPQLVEQFCNSTRHSGIFFRLLNNVAPFNEEITNRIVKETIRHWNYWQKEFVIDRIKVTKKANVLIAEIEMVLQALRNSVDGLLLIDQRLKKQLCKSRRANALFNSADELMNQLELFLKRGNRIEITETGLLKEYGEIVLLPYKPVGFFSITPAANSEKYNSQDTY